MPLQKNNRKEYDMMIFVKKYKDFHNFQLIFFHETSSDKYLTSLSVVSLTVHSYTVKYYAFYT